MQYRIAFIWEIERKKAKESYVVGSLLHGGTSPARVKHCNNNITRDLSTHLIKIYRRDPRRIGNPNLYTYDEITRRHVILLFKN